MMHQFVLIQGSSVRNEIMLLATSLEQEDSCWEQRVRCGRYWAAVGNVIQHNKYKYMPMKTFSSYEFMLITYEFCICSDEIVPDGNANEAASNYGHYQTTLLEDSTTTC